MDSPNALLASLYPNASADIGAETLEADAGTKTAGAEGGGEGVDLSALSDEQVMELRKEADSRDYLLQFTKLAEDTGYDVEKIAEAHTLAIIQADAAWDRKLWLNKSAGLIDPYQYMKLAVSATGNIYDEDFNPVEYTQDELEDALSDGEEDGGE